MTTETRTIASFMDAHGITATVEGIDERTDGLGWSAESRHFRVTFTRDGYDGSWPVEFSQGPAVKDAPEPRQVLACVVSDVASIDGYSGDQSEWLADFGYLDGTAKVHARGLIAWEAIETQRDDLSSLLGGDRSLLDALLYEIERQDDE